MEELIRLLDENLHYDGHEIRDEEIYIRVSSMREMMSRPYCGQESKQIHSRMERTLKDLPIQGKATSGKAQVFCGNPECEYRTYAERFGFLNPEGSKRGAWRKKYYKYP